MVDTLLDNGISTKRSSGNEKTTCPQCSDNRRNKKEKCLSVNHDKGVWNCHHCGWAGGLRVERSQRVMKTYKRPEVVPTNELNPNALKFFSDRGIPEEVLNRNGVYSTRKWFAEVGKELPAIAFPFYRGGELVNVKYRGPEVIPGKKLFTQEAEAEPIFYGYDDIDNDITLIVEGEMDKLAMELGGFTNTISVPAGAPAPGTQNYTSKFDFLENCEERISQVKQFIIATDQDEPGVCLREELARRLGRERCLFVVWPEGVKDANEMLMKHGVLDLISLVYEAKPFPIQEVAELNPQEILDYYRYGMKPGLDTGWAGLDSLYSIQSNELTVITGIPNSGKSLVVDNICIHLAKKHGWRFMVFSPEHAPVKNHVVLYSEKYTGKTADINGGSTRMTEAELLDAVGWVDSHFYFIDPERGTHPLDRILEVSKELLYRKGINAIVIDPWNEIEVHTPKDVTETNYIGQCLQRIRQFARQNDVHIFIVAHPKKLTKNKDTNEYEIPMPYDIAGSSHWFNKADNCLTVWRPSTAGEPVKVFTQKIKFQKTGKKGVTSLQYNANNGRYISI